MAHLVFRRLGIALMSARVCAVRGLMVTFLGIDVVGGL